MIKRILTAIKIRINNRINYKLDLDILRERGLVYGKNFKFFNSTIDYGHCWLVEIGDDVTITNSTILAHDATTKLFLGKAKVGKVKIGNRVFVGYGSIILCNITIGDDVIIAAGTVVTKNVPSGCIVGGNPARIIGKTEDYITKHNTFFKNKKVYDTYWPYKTQEQIEQMKDELESDFGYDE